MTTRSRRSSTPARSTADRAPQRPELRRRRHASIGERVGAASFATGWEQCLTGLRSVLRGERLPPADRGIARHEELVREFDLDRPEVTEAAGRWTVRIERQLTCPAAVAWDLWFGSDQTVRRQ